MRYFALVMLVTTPAWAQLDSTAQALQQAQIEQLNTQRDAAVTDRDKLKAIAEQIRTRQKDKQ